MKYQFIPDLPVVLVWSIGEYIASGDPRFPPVVVVEFSHLVQSW